MRHACYLVAFLLAAALAVVLSLSLGPRRTDLPHGQTQAERGEVPAVTYRAKPRYLPDGRYVGPPVERPMQPLNLVMIVIDTLRDDCVWDGDDRPGDMPFLASLAKRGARLSQVSAPTGWTCPSLASIFTARTPDRHGVEQDPYTPVFSPGLPTLAEILSQAHGYETAAFAALEFPRAERDLYEGFDVVRLGRPLEPAHGWIEAWDRTRDPDRPYFLFLHTYQAHDPYGEANQLWPKRRPTPEDVARVGSHRDYTPSALTERFMTDYGARVALLQEGREHTIAALSRYLGRGYAQAPDLALARRLEQAYRDGVRWVDQELDATVAFLERRGLLANTLLVVTSDHGEAFGEHGVLAHGRTLHEEVVHVPLVAVGPEPFVGGRRIGTSLGLIDLMPTFLDLAGLPPFTQGEGRSMLAELRANADGRAVLSIDVLTPWKTGRDALELLVSARSSQASYLAGYDLADGSFREHYYDRSVDPAERDDLAVSGRLGDRPVSPTMVPAIEATRDRLWRLIDHATGGTPKNAVAHAARPRPQPVR